MSLIHIIRHYAYCHYFLISPGFDWYHANIIRHACHFDCLRHCHYTHFYWRPLIFITTLHYRHCISIRSWLFFRAFRHFFNTTHIAVIAAIIDAFIDYWLLLIIRFSIFSHWLFAFHLIFSLLYYAIIFIAIRYCYYTLPLAFHTLRINTHTYDIIIGFFLIITHGYFATLLHSWLI